LFTALVATTACNVAGAQVAPTLGYAQNFAVLGGTTVTNTDATDITGDLGVSPGTAITGFPPGTVTRAFVHDADTYAGYAQRDAAAAYGKLAGQACTTSYAVPTDLGGMTLTPGVYCFSSSAQLTGSLTLDAQGDPNAVWIFQIGSTLTTASASTVQLANSAQQHNVFWQVGSSATLGTGSTFQGQILAQASITLTTNVNLSGRALALTGAVTLDADNVSSCVCLLPYGAITSTVVNTISVAPSSGSVFGATLSPDGKSVWVAASSGNSGPGFVSVLDVPSQSVRSSFAVGAGPEDIAFSSTGGRAFVTNRQDATLSVVSVKSQTVKQTLDLSTTPLSQPFGVAFDSGELIVTTQGSGNLLPEIATNPAQLVLGQSISISGQSGRPAVAPPGAPYHLAYTVMVPVLVTGTGSDAGHPALVLVNPANGTATSRVVLYSSRATPEAVVLSPDGNYAYVSLFDSTGGTGGVWVVSLATLTTKTVILTCDPHNYGEAISADGKYLLVTGFSENQVALIDTATYTVDAIIPGGNQPNAIALTSDNSEAFFTNQTDGTVTVVSFTPSL